MKIENPLVTVIEHPHYQKNAERLLTAEQRTEVINILAVTPNAGELIVGTGGFRKMRYASVAGKGKSSGARVIHLFANNKGEVHLLHIYAKSEEENLTKEERNELAKIAAKIKE